MLLQKMFIFVGMLMAFACASQDGPVIHDGNHSQNDDSVTPEAIIAQFREAQRKGLASTAMSMGPVSEKSACQCKVCLQPLFKHDREDFECLPRNKEGELISIAKIIEEKVSCPSCGEVFKGALRSKNINDDGGVDADFCVHSVGKYVIQSKVWMCPDCGYAGLMAGWGKTVDGKPVPESTKEFVKEKLKEDARKRITAYLGINLRVDGDIPEGYKHFSTYVLQPELPDWIKYDHALKIYEQTKLPYSFMATMYLDAAHACRREVCSEVAVPGLQGSVQKNLGASIRRVNGLLQVECLNIRRKRGDTVVDPTKLELDQTMIVLAAESIIKQGENIATDAATPRTDNRPSRLKESAFLKDSDMFILYIRLAGAYDRLGYYSKAAKALTDAAGEMAKSKNFVIDLVESRLNASDRKCFEEYYNAQYSKLIAVLEDRKECLKREQVFLVKAGDCNLAALKFRELPIKKINLKTLAEGSVDVDERFFDPAPTAHLLGEIFRRSNDMTEASYFYGIADCVLTQYLKDVEVACHALGDSISEANKTKFHALDIARQGWERLRERNDLQRSSVVSKDTLNPYVKTIGEILLTAVGLTSAELNKVTAPVTSSKPATPTDVTPVKVSVTDSPIKNTGSPTVTPPEVSAKIKTRSELYLMYATAIKKYFAEKNENPPDLKTLVTGGYIAAADSCLDSAGKLWCPEETKPNVKAKLQYSKTWTLGSAEMPVIYPIKGEGTVLYANWEVRQFVQK
jgi:hypothetical protein